MRVSKGFNPVTKAVGVFAAVAIIVGGVTYAAFQSQATLSDNTISSATAGLQVDNLGNGAGFATSDAGFSFTGIVPGADYGTPQQFKLKNSGDTDLQVTVFATDGASSGILNKNKIHVKFTNTSLSTPGSVEYTLAELQSMEKGLPGMGIASNDSLDTSGSGEENTFNVQVKIDADAVNNGNGASVSGFDLVLTGYPAVDTEGTPVNTND
jgi:predicted ribosomally synthesized peptide with SipW-like signal peptide